MTFLSLGSAFLDISETDMELTEQEPPYPAIRSLFLTAAAIKKLYGALVVMTAILSSQDEE